MAEFCKCGSLVINGRCTNKSCAVKTHETKPAKAETEKKTRTAVPRVKTTKTKRASKCVTYNLYETQNEEGNNF